MNNSLDMIKSFMNSGGNPQQFIQNLKNNNPMLSNIIQMAQKGDAKGVENFARNLFKENGRDFDKEFASFMSNFK